MVLLYACVNKPIPPTNLCPKSAGLGERPSFLIFLNNLSFFYICFFIGWVNSQNCCVYSSQKKHLMFCKVVIVGESVYRG